MNLRFPQHSPAIEQSHTISLTIIVLGKNWVRGPNCWDLMRDDLTRSWGSNNRNKVHNKCNALESSRHHPPCPHPQKNCLPRNWSLVPNRLGTTVLKDRGGARGMTQHLSVHVCILKPCYNIFSLWCFNRGCIPIQAPGSSKSNSFSCRMSWEFYLALSIRKVK